MKLSEGIAESIALALNCYEISDKDYRAVFEGAARVFTAYVNDHAPEGVTFDAERCAFEGGADRLAKADQERLLREAEIETDEWIEFAADELEWAE